MIRKVTDQKAMTNIEGHPKLDAYLLLQRGDNESSYLSIAFDRIYPGGGIDPHYHTDSPSFDHAFYVLSGDIIVSIAGKEQRVGANTLIYCHSNEVHSIRNAGSSEATLLLIKASAGDDAQGKSVYL